MEDTSDNWDRNKIFAIFHTILTCSCLKENISISIKMSLKLVPKDPVDNFLRKYQVAHYCDVIVGSMASQIISRTIVYSTIHSGKDQRIKSKLRVTDFCARNSPLTGEFPAQMTSNAEKFSIWWRHHKLCWWGSNALFATILTRISHAIWRF